MLEAVETGLGVAEFKTGKAGESLTISINFSG
jgi:hypothetical protein